MSSIKKNRKTSIEVLRIVSIFFIVLSHSSVHGGFGIPGLDFSANKFWLNCFTLGNLGVDIFVLISGYFLSKKAFDLKALLKLLMQVLFYSIVAFVIGICLGYEFSVTGTISVFLPTIFNKYWFITAYVVLVIISPFINVLIKSISRKKLKQLIFVLLLLWVLIPTFTTNTMYGDQIPQFVMFYLIGAYFSYYPENTFNKRFIRLSVTMVSFCLLFASTFVFGILERYVGFFKYYGSYFYSRTSLLVVGCAVGLLSLAIYHKKFSNKLINTISGCTLGVYLIHDNPIIRELLWNKIFDNTAYVNDVLLPIRLLICSLIVYIVSTIIEYIRQLVLGKPINFFSTKLAERIKKMLAKFSVEGN